MKNNNYIKTKIRQSVWLLMACLCIVFSGAMKKILQLHADQKISMFLHANCDGNHSITQNIKDGHREKHEIQTIVFSENKQFPVPNLNTSFHSCLFQASPMLVNICKWTSAMVSYKSSQAIASGPARVYLLFCRLQV